MLSKKRRLNDSRLYLILDKEVCGENMKPILEKALQGGVDIVQYRDKVSSNKVMAKAGEPLFDICRKYRVPFIVNDRLDVALALDADGLHIGQDDMPVALARKLLGQNKIIGLSCHSARQVMNAQNTDSDYLGFGPVFKTLTKPRVAARGIQGFKKALKASKLPIFAIGGITKYNISQMSTMGIIRIACIREICLASDPRTAALKLKICIKN